MVEIVEAEARARYHPVEPAPEVRPWSEFRERRDRTSHARRLFVSKYNPATWGDPSHDPESWDPVVPALWIHDQPDGPLSSPDLGLGVTGDLVVVMRLEYRSKNDAPRSINALGPSDDPSPFRGRATLLGVWHIVRRRVRRWSTGPNRPVTELWHLPLVRFADDDAVDVESLRSLDPSIDRMRPFTARNWSFVACANANEAALLASACSLPSEVFTTPDLIGLAARLQHMRCGMQDWHRKYWKDLKYRHELRQLTEETAIRVSARALADRGWDVDSKAQRIPNWGGDLDCWRDHPVTGVLEKRCVEVKGTRHDPWEGHVHLERSQRARARRTATGQPAPGEEGYDWELQVQAGIPADHEPSRDTSLPSLAVHDARWVEQNWLPKWVAQR